MPTLSTAAKAAAFALLATLSPLASANDNGINFPPTQGTSGTGAFLPGVYTLNYTNTSIANAALVFNAARIPINVETANNPEALQKIKGYFDQINKNGIICMFDTLQGAQTGHGDGLPNDITAIANAWKKIHAVFSGYPNVMYEIFNEPFGYNKNNPTAYVNEMKSIISQAGLPTGRCILDGMGYAADIKLTVQGGWTGYLGYHFYPNWSPSDFTQSAYSNIVQNALAGNSTKTFITEFGANLSYNNPNYGQFDNGSNGQQSANVNALRGLDDALRALKAQGKGVLGAYHWHGYHNNDTYDFWAAANDNGANKVETIEAND